MEFKKSIGKMGSLAKSGAYKAGANLKEEAKETFTKENAKHFLHEARETTGTVIHEGSKAADKLATYGARVDRNASQSWLLNRPPKQAVHRKVKPTNRTIVININSRSTKKRRHHSKLRYGLS